MKKRPSKFSWLLPILTIQILVSLLFAVAVYARDNTQVVVYQTSWLNPVPTPPAPQILSKNTLPTDDPRSWTKYEYSYLIAQTAEKYDLDPQLIYATIMTESEGNEHAYRPEPYLNDASYCLGQILVTTARSLGFTGAPSELFIPEVCIDLIGKYHKNNLEIYGHLSPQQLARAYNTGSPWKRPIWGHLSRFNKWFYEESLF